MFDPIMLKISGQFFLNGLMVGGIYALIALGVVVIYKSTKIFNFAVGDMLMVGGFITFMFIDMGIPPLAAMILAVVAGALLGLIIERLALRPLIGQPVLAAVMVTLSISYLLKGITLLVWGGHPETFPRFLPGRVFRAWGVVWSHELLWTFGVTMALFVLVAFFYKFSRFGLDMRATAEDHQLAQTKGISVKRIFSMTWALAGITAVVGGIFLGLKLSLNLPLADVGLKSFAAVIFGGLESILGALIGGLIIGILENMIGGLVDPSLKEITPYIILLLVLIFRTEGLFGLKRIERI
ncbi:MAG: branched-chain amino acid ABC transporter permease [Deltaproteobacteria bacterium]|nr:branched-chain amino acid ABC transporter permease [Deltaproteobacteria bacterium]MBW1993284.1 branched-chain amino acid ABC transporter permease [Deltaproteobacteria bacterium]MBW2154087.1 branched-chain amino acid ABC transporter permease [Deltaproteobacteria bacterium]